MRSLLLIVAAATAPLAVHAWGDVGHRTVGYLASKYLSDSAKDWANELLKNDQGFDISDAAVWADVVKHKRPYTAEWHYIDAQDKPPKSCGVTFDRDCAGHSGCIVSAIINQTSLLLDSSQDSTTHKEALMYLIHFLGDIHQPLHVENLDRGGNDIHVCFDHRCNKENLHGIWDTDIIHKARGLKHSEKHNEEKEAASKWADELHDKDSGTSIADECTDIHDPEKCAMEWAAETNQLVCSYVLAKGTDWLENNDLGGSYYDGAVPVVEDRIGRAGRRLGGWIEALAAEVSGQRDL